VTLPPLPRSIQGLAGPIKIDRPMVVDPKDKFTAGMWIDLERRILVLSTANREAAYSIFLHELCHAAISDAGITLPLIREEAVCQAVSSMMMHVVRLLSDVSRGHVPKTPKAVKRAKPRRD
jgi:hypothetical protein